MKSLEIINVCKSFKGRKVVDEVSIAVKQGEIIGLLGPNGAGKTTTFLMILGLHKPDSGIIKLDSLDITNMPVYIRARLGISFLPQEPSIFTGLTVKENILSVIEMSKHKEKFTLDKMHDVVDEMGLTELMERKSYLLSGGERRRLEIARALVLSPDFLLLDEPFAGIDPIQIGEIQKLILNLRDKGLGIIITDHNVREILKITDKSYIVNRGSVIFQGNAESLISNEVVREEYLGQEFRWD
jgi:lipopolysaccharide export system ATP-binding protein